jgi:hypothetical protein
MLEVISVCVSIVYVFSRFCDSTISSFIDAGKKRKNKMLFAFKSYKLNVILKY